VADFAVSAALFPQTRRKKSNRWNPADDLKLLGAVEEHGSANWALVSQVVGGDRTRSQCAQRWHRVLDPKIDKSNWSHQEEQKLIDLVAAHGDKSWTKIAANMGSRCDVQCRFRYKFLLRKAEGVPSAVRPISAPDSVLPLPSTMPH
jgi:hypothetical protein